MSGCLSCSIHPRRLLQLLWVRHTVFEVFGRFALKRGAQAGRCVGEVYDWLIADRCIVGADTVCFKQEASRFGRIGFLACRFGGIIWPWNQFGSSH